MVAKTLFGFEELLAKELRNLGAANVKEGVRSVSFDGDTGFMYKANLCLRTAIKIIKPIHSFSVQNENRFSDGRLIRSEVETRNALTSGWHAFAEQLRGRWSFASHNDCLGVSLFAARQSQRLSVHVVHRRIGDYRSLG